MYIPAPWPWAKLFFKVLLEIAMFLLNKMLKAAPVYAIFYSSFEFLMEIKWPYSIDIPLPLWLVLFKKELFYTVMFIESWMLSPEN